VSLRVNRQAFAASLRRIQDAAKSRPDAVARALHPVFRGWAADWEKDVQSRLRGDPLKSRSGRLRGSLQSFVSGSKLDDLKLRLQGGEGVAYAHKQERGGVIKPKNGKYLTIPTRANLSAAGVSRFPSARALIAANPGKTFFRRTDEGKLLLFLNQGVSETIRRAHNAGLPKGGVRAKKGDAVPMFLLVRSVDLPGPDSPTKKAPSRLGFHDTWNAMRARRGADLANLKVGP